MSEINPGIRKTVEWLTAQGFITTDSGDGSTGDFACDLPCPYVHMLVAPALLVSETDRLVQLLAARGVKVQPMDEACSVPVIEGSYNPGDGIGATISLYNVKL